MGQEHGRITSHDVLLSTLQKRNNHGARHPLQISKASKPHLKTDNKKRSKI